MIRALLSDLAALVLGAKCARCRVRCYPADWAAHPCRKATS